MTTVNIFLPTCGEPTEILNNSYSYVSQIRNSGVRVYVLDDGSREEVRAMAQYYGFQYIARSSNFLKKAGNIRHAFSMVPRAEFLVIFDADFCPRPDFLDVALPHIDQDVGILQTPQFFDIKDQPNSLASGAARIQELFYRLIQTNRDKFGGAICVGTNAIYRWVALEPHGGTYPIEHSEDVHTGFQLLRDGWKIKYLPLNLAAGLCPDTLKAFLNQQYRWCMGSMSLMTNWQFFWKAPISFMQRLCYISGFLYYITTAFSIFLLPLPGILLIWLRPENIRAVNMVFFVPALCFPLFLNFVWSRQGYGWDAMKAQLMANYAHAFAIWDKMRGNVIGWLPTGNSGTQATLLHRFKLVARGWSLLGFGLALSGFVMNWPNMEMLPILLVVGISFGLTQSALAD